MKKCLPLWTILSSLLQTLGKLEKVGEALWFCHKRLVKRLPNASQIELFYSESTLLGCRTLATSSNRTYTPWKIYRWVSCLHTGQSLIQDLIDWAVLLNFVIQYLVFPVRVRFRHLNNALLAKTVFQMIIIIGQLLLPWGSECGWLSRELSFCLGYGHLHFLHLMLDRFKVVLLIV